MNNLLTGTKFAILSTLLFAFAVTALADVKIKSRQTMSGQSYENTTYIKGKRQRTESMGGMMINLTQCDLQRGVQINPGTMTYVINPFNVGSPSSVSVPNTKNDGNMVRAGGTVTTTVTTKDTGERKQMFGFTAKHLIMTIETASSPDACSVNNSKMEMDGWYIDAEFVLDCDQNSIYQSYNDTMKAGCRDKYNFNQVGAAKRGFPVYEKLTMFGENGKESMSSVSEVIELSKATLHAGLFDIPSDYREVSESSAMYTPLLNYAASSVIPTNDRGGNSSDQGDPGISRNVNNTAQNPSDPGSDVGRKKNGIIRIGMANVKTGSVGEGTRAADLAAAIQNSLTEYLTAPGVEIVPIEAKLPSAITLEAAEKECDYIILANVTHNKGGGGGLGGVFGKVIAPAIGQTGIGHTGSLAGNIAGQVATTTIVSAGSMSANVKSKDQIALEVVLQAVGGTPALSRKYNAKAKSDGEDIISPMIEQAAEAIVQHLKK